MTVNSYFNLDQKTSIAIAFVTGLGLFIFIDDRLQVPKLESIQRALGFYAYANIYSSLTEVMYRETAGGPCFNANTGNFTDLIDVLKARLDLERQTIAHWIRSDCNYRRADETIRLIGKNYGECKSSIWNKYICDGRFCSN